MPKKSLKIESKIYSKEAIKEAIEAYSDIAKISFSSWVLSIELSNGEDLEEITNEFMNYVLALQNESI